MKVPIMNKLEYYVFEMERKHQEHSINITHLFMNENPMEHQTAFFPIEMRKQLHKILLTCFYSGRSLLHVFPRNKMHKNKFKFI